MLITVDSFDTPRSLWHTDPVFRSRVLAEWDKIEPYKAKGFIGVAGGVEDANAIVTPSPARPR